MKTRNNKLLTPNKQQLITKKYKIKILYIGAKFFGFQTQTNKKGIQDHIEAALGILLKKTTKLKGASRTDSGVHALGQIATFETSLAVNLDTFLVSLNALLPRDIGIQSIVEVKSDFDPIYHAKAKLYRYCLWRGKCFNPFMDRYVWSVNRSLNTDCIKEALPILLGRHDFSSFCNSDSGAKTRVRTLIEADLIENDNKIEIWFLGEGFLKQMIRILVGTLVDVTMKKNNFLKLEEILKSKNRQLSGQTAPAKGLTLVEIYYESVPTLNDVILKKRNKSSFLF